MVADECLKRISNILLLNSCFIDNLGLLNGKMGIAIFFYHYFKFTENKIYEEYAGELIDQIYAEINTMLPVNLSDGLTGIGWGIEYLVKKGFVQADTDEALSEIDSTIYRIRLNTPVLVNPDDNFFSYGHYYISRLCGHKIDDDDLNTLIKKYHLIFMIDECERIVGVESLNPDQFRSVAWFVIEADNLGIFPFKTKKILEKIRVNSLCEEKSPGIQVNAGNGFSENDVNVFIKRAWERLIYQDYNKANHPCIDELLGYISCEENWKARLNNLRKENLGLNGLAGLGLGLLLLMTESKPQVKHLITQNAR